MRSRSLLFDLLFLLLAVMALALPLMQLSAAAYVAASEALLQQRYVEVCNVEGNLCLIKSGAAASSPFGRLMPGQ